MPEEVRVENMKRRGGRPRIREESSRLGAYVGFKSPPDLKEKLETSAAIAERSLSAETRERVERSFWDPTFPPEIAALLELLGRTMVDTITGISGVNRWSGHGSNQPGLAQPYAYSQAVAGAMHVLQLTLPEGPAEPHGFFAMADYPRERADQVGKQIADGILEAMRGRHPDPGTAALWVPRVRKKLGIIGDRLDQHSVPEEYIGPPTTEPEKIVLTPNAEGGHDLRVEADEADWPEKDEHEL